MWKSKFISFKFLFATILFFILLIFSNLSAFAQVISGKVTDEETGEPLPFTNVFVSNTTIGSTTDINGNYMIRGKLPQNFELAVSFVGYYTKFRTVSLSGRDQVTVNFTLQQRVNQLDAVQLRSKRDKKWERNLRRFQRTFLALVDDPFYERSRILNPWVLDFHEGREKGLKYFAATAEEPLQIENRALGYSIEYHLQNFLETRLGFNYYGLVNIKNLSEQLSDQEELNRESTFQGSTRHFIQKMLNNTIDTLEYQFFKLIPAGLNKSRTNDFYHELDRSIEMLHRDSLYICDLPNGYQLIELPSKIEVHFLKKPWRNDYYENVYHTISWLEAPEGYFIVDEFGVLPDPGQLVISGYMGRERMARFLPHDFEPTMDLQVFETELDSLSLDLLKWNNLREKPHITLNKSYYHPGEAIWFSSKMLYQNQIFSDSLSKVLYVDLYDDTYQTVLSETFPIDQGLTSGMMVLPENLNPGNYVLRAYTQWMRNFGDDGMTFLPIPILESFQTAQSTRAKEEELEEDDIELEIAATFESGEFGTKAKVEISIPFTAQNKYEGHYSISVLDNDLYADLRQHTTFEQALDWLDGKSKSILFTEPRFPIEFGISVSGYFSDRPKKPLNVPITIVQGELENYGITTADSTGYFWATGLQFQDSVDISIAALNQKRRRYGKIILSPVLRPKVEQYLPRLAFQVSERKMDTHQFAFYDLMEGEYFELDEFTLTETPQFDMEAENYGYGKGDRSIGQDFLQRWPDRTVNQIIEMYFPGGGMQRYNVGVNAGEPLVMVDGARIFSTPQEPALNYLNSLVADEVESIEIYTFSAPAFGMHGFAGAIIVKTKKGKRVPKNDQIFDTSEFERFKVKGFTKVPSFPVIEEPEKFIERRSVIYWNPNVQWSEENDTFSFDFNFSSQTKRLLFKVIGVTWDGTPLGKYFEIEVPE
jgi:hypothetical protein